ncbi:MAG TPA: aldolase/citrate lyase family protein [Candidatus Limnocylindrales bacterium]|nr:aldolase/citrate lyase family protein [Candidatus Limnocylindrales bacterium]
MTDDAGTSGRPDAGGRLRGRVRAGETVFGAFLMLGAPLAAELCGRAGFDWLVVDLEHGAGTEADLLAQLYATEVTPAEPIVRVEVASRLRIGRALDLGAGGIMVPRLETAEEAADVVSWIRFPPGGRRGVALGTRGAGLGEVGHPDVRHVGESILCVVQIETLRALDNARSIAAVDGVDVLFVGPTDLSHSLGLPGAFDDPAFRAALDGVVDAATGAGKAAGILLRTLDDLPRTLAAGFRFVGLGSDGAFVTDGARAAVRAARALVGESRGA